jgi:putative transposase
MPPGERKNVFAGRAIDGDRQAR